MTNLPALPEPTALDVAAVADLAGQLLAWAESTDDVAAVRDAADRWAAITAYVRRSSRTGIAEAEAALRRLEVRIGKLLGPATPNGKGLGSDATDPGLSADARHDLRTLAEYPEIVEKVIANSDDLNPPSRRKCLAEIDRQRQIAEFDAIHAETEAAAPAILAALAEMPEPSYPTWTVHLRFRSMHADDVRAVLPDEAELIRIEEEPACP